MTVTMPASHLSLRVSLFVLLLGAGVNAQDPGVGNKQPNVLLIVDTSGSMEYVSGSSAYPVCYPAGGTPSERSRWVDLVEVLSGTISNYRCETIDRTSSGFRTAFRLPGSVDPPDADYRNPYHRPLSGTCAPGADSAGLSVLSSAPGNAFGWVPPKFSDYSSGTACASYAQAADGLIDSLGDSVRFGLMTFDTLPDGSTGQSGPSAYSPNWAVGARGAFSYFLSSPAVGKPQACLTPAQPQEVGARNGAAPAWEGKMIHFGNPDAGDNSVRHGRIEKVLLSTRPYGATPIAGALADAREFLLYDKTDDPTPTNDALYYTWNGGTAHYGPVEDPYVMEGCRKQYVILLTDGEPNLDLRPFCEDGSGDINCPYKKSADIAESLLTTLPVTSMQPVPTYVVGFAPETAGGVDCTTLDQTAYASGGVCVSPTDPDLAACCRLTEIAYRGGTQQAYFANDKTALRSQLSEIFRQIVNFSGSATQPVRSPGVGTQEGATKAFRILTSYTTGDSGLWHGNVERLRWTCESTNGGPLVPTEQAKDPDLGDDFSFNINKNPTDRVFKTYVPEDDGGVIHSDWTVRPNIASSMNDGLGDYGRSSVATVVSGTPNTFASTLPAEALMADLSSGSCSGLTATACRDLLTPWYVGLDNGSGEHRCATAASAPGDPECSVIGDVMHSTPVIVNHPGALVEDETYVTYAYQQNSRPMMVYTSSNDGVFHGFYLSPNDLATNIVASSDSNETFAFVPPAILPTLQAQYPNNRGKFLDGVSVVQDVVATDNGSGGYYPFILERGSANFTSGTETTWRTVLVQSFGGNTAGFYAMDITDPTDPTFLWQLLTDSTGKPIFGERATTPLITTLNVSGNEVAVAILPGGYGSPGTGACPRATSTFSNIASGFDPRSEVRCYEFDKNNNAVVDGTDDVTYAGARSLTVVRLDTGEIIRSFRRNAAEAPGLPSTVIVQSDLDSPLTGAPAAYPAGTGAVADRVFIGDQDGTLWKVDFSSPSPTDWSMALFFDAFAKHPDVGTPSLAATQSHPIIAAPTLSIDQIGQVTIAVASGDQDLSGGTDDENYVWSLRESVNTSGSTPFLTEVNWYEELTAGTHVLGPMSLLGEVLYFATYSPDVAKNVCLTGTSSVYGVHYLNPGDPSDLSLGGYGLLSVVDNGDTVKSHTAAEMGLPADTLIFGVALEYVPSCNDTSTPAATWLGANRRSVTNVTASPLQLTFQTGTVDTSKKDLGFTTGFESKALTPPRSAATIEAWAPILE